MDFAEHLKKSDDSENSKIYYSRFLQNGLHQKDIIYLVKADEMHNILKSAGHCLLVERKMELDYQSFCWSLPLNVYYAPPLLRGRLIRVPKVAFHVFDKLKNEIQHFIIRFYYYLNMKNEIQIFDYHFHV